MASVPSTQRLKDELDIVIPTIRNLDFLEMWRSFQLYQLIIVQDGDPTRTIRVPDGFDYELHNRNNINRPGPPACPSRSPPAAASATWSPRSTSTPSTTTASLPKGIWQGDQHTRAAHKETSLALQLPSFSILCMTLIVRAQILFTGILSASAKVSKPLLLMDFGLIFQTMMPRPSLSSLLRGILGHLRSPRPGCEDKASLYLAQQGKQPTCEPQKGVQGDFLAVGDNRLLSAHSDCDTIHKCYIELSKQVKAKLGKVDPYFDKLADAMVTWIEAWDLLNPTRRSHATSPAAAKGK